jgi:hypothetical protein
MSLLVRASNLQQARVAVPRAQRRAISVRAAENNGASTSTSEPTIFYAGQALKESEVRYWQNWPDGSDAPPPPPAQPPTVLTVPFCPQWNTAIQNGTITPPATSSSPVAAAVAAPSIVDVMAFGGAAPEITNGRLAMLGFVSAVAAELSSGELWMSGGPATYDAAQPDAQAGAGLMSAWLLRPWYGPRCICTAMTHRPAL